jgi:hypothetical protein
VAKRLGIKPDDARQVMRAVAGKESARDLSVEEATIVMRKLRWLADGFIEIEAGEDGQPRLVDARPANPGPSSPGQRVDG